jgi:hypothetical protein
VRCVRPSAALIGALEKLILLCRTRTS